MQHPVILCQKLVIVPWAIMHGIYDTAVQTNPSLVRRDAVKCGVKICHCFANQLVMLGMRSVPRVCTLVFVIYSS